MLASGLRCIGGFGAIRLRWWSTTLLPWTSNFITASASDQALASTAVFCARLVADRRMVKQVDRLRCRFYGSVSPGPNLHFYTASQSDCDLLCALQAITCPLRSSGRNFESLDFMTTSATNGTCPANLVPVSTLANGVGRGIDGNHRFSTSASAIAEVVARGWVNEGGR